MAAASSSCPHLTPDLVPPTTEPLPSAAPWHPALAVGEAPRANSSHFYMYVPSLKSEQEQHAMRLVLRANQFPNDPAMCNRTLHLYDDALTAGLGYTARLIALALLVAVQEKRVLILVPHASARWCAREPYTLGCYYEPITHCTYRPDWQNISFKWSTRGSSFGLEGRRAMSAPHLRISTSQVHRSIFWYKFHPPQTLFAGTHELLFKPRAWVRDAAKCVMRQGGLRGGNYAVVHARFSAEKKKERGSTLPPLSDYLPATRTMLGRANASRVFLQTSTPDAVSLFEQWAEAHSWKLSYTSNARSRNDLWVVGSGKHTTNHSGEQISVVAQTVNALVASRSRHFLSPSSSMWTWFIRALMGRKVSDTINDVGGEIFEECVAALQKAKEHPEGSNTSLADVKRCKKAVPKLLMLHRLPPNRAVEEEL